MDRTEKKDIGAMHAKKRAAFNFWVGCLVEYMNLEGSWDDFTSRSRRIGWLWLPGKCYPDEM